MTEVEEFDPFSEVPAEEQAAAGAVFPDERMDSSAAPSMTPRPPSEVIRAPYTPDDEEEPPDPEGHALTKEQADFMASDDFFRGPLPHDIAAIWAHPPMRRGDEATARILIAAWGLDGFRGSALHQAALAEVARKDAKAEDTQRFKAEREKTKQKGRR